MVLLRSFFSKFFFSKLFFLVYLGIGFSMLPSIATSENIITHIRPLSNNDVRSYYYIDLLKAVLAKTEAEYGPATLQKAKVRIKQSRAVQLVRDKAGLDIMWTMTSVDREEQLLPIRIPLQKGLLGHRIFIIRDGEQAKFDTVANMAELSALRAGQGHDWPDTEILRHNQLTVQTSPDYGGLFRMLEAGRFDYFPRGVAEPFQEVENRPDMGLTIENKILLKYPAPIYYFVSKSNPQLAQRLEAGLRKMIDDGSFHEFFINHDAIKPILKQANISGRKTFELDNPLLTPETRAILSDKTLWYDGESSL